MEASVSRIPVPGVVAAPPAGPEPRSVTWLAYAVLFASTSVIVGVLWDISWHQSIGRDTLFSPPHLAIYLGGVVAGLACGWHVLRVTFRGSAAEKAAGVGFWGFRGPLAAWVCIWGALAMITSAPFDDWWHNAYGLDVMILSPPHAVLAAGIWAIQLGAMLLVLALQNRATGARQRLYGWMFLFAAGLVVLNLATMTSEYTWRIWMHNALFYQVTAGVFPLVLVGAARAARMPWPATTAAGVYMGFTMVTMWVLQLFPAEPKLAPILYEVTRMVPPWFPLLLVVPAIGIDLVMRRWPAGRSDWLLAAALGAVFFALFLPAQWFFAKFLMTDAARNWFFATHLLPYMVPPTSAFAEGRFVLTHTSTGELLAGLAWAPLLAFLSARLGLAWGGWMRRVQR
jgi:hypothetical protein